MKVSLHKYTSGEFGLYVDKRVVGYVSLEGKDREEMRETIKYELYLAGHVPDEGQLAHLIDLALEMIWE